jgi:hypothetical protein
VPIGGDPPLPADVIPPPPPPPLPPPSPDQSDPMVEDDSQVPVGFRPLGVRGNASHAFLSLHMVRSRIIGQIEV